VTIRLLIGHCLDRLEELAPESVHCVVTSPPYWGLRSYGTEPQRWPDGWEGELGLEPSPAVYVDHLVAVFRAVRRVLRRDGTLWLNLGDTYATGGGKAKKAGGGEDRPKRMGVASQPNRALEGLKPGDLIGVPWRAAFALQADGWYLRQDNIWSKPNPNLMPSAKDRCTTAHEYLFHFSKSENYFFDSVAIEEPAIEESPKGGKTRQKRSVWTVQVRPFAEAHFATFPTELIFPCILAGTSTRGVCPKCGAQWRRRKDGDWKAACPHSREAPVAATVLDPFLGSGTTALVADRLARNAVGIELNPGYVKIGEKRITDDAGFLFGEPLQVTRPGEPAQIGLF
jgi:DNA modification methylase